MKMVILCTIVSLSLFAFQPGDVKAEDNNKTWTIYVGVEPSEAYLHIKYYKEGKFDAAMYKYPLYIGYFYTEDSKVIKWKCLMPFMEPLMASWGDWHNNPRVRAVDDWMPGRYRTAKLGDDNYAEIAGEGMVRSLRAIKITKGKLPDDSWIPQFKGQYSLTPLSAEELKLRDWDDRLTNKFQGVIKDPHAWDVLNSPGPAKD